MERKRARGGGGGEGAWPVHSRTSMRVSLLATELNASPTLSDLLTVALKPAATPAPAAMPIRRAIIILKCLLVRRAPPNGIVASSYPTVGGF